MRTLHVGLRVADLARSLAFYEAIGYGVVGSVPETPIGHLTMLKLPDDEFVTLELVHDGKPVEQRHRSEPPRREGRVDGGHSGCPCLTWDRGRRPRSEK